jgi:hypothetical protein
MSSYIIYSNYAAGSHLHRHHIAHPAAHGQQDDHEGEKENAHFVMIRRWLVSFDLLGQISFVLFPCGNLHAFG